MIDDARYDTLRGLFPTLGSQTAENYAQEVADALADLDPAISPGEARMILTAMVASWDAVCDTAKIEDLAGWCSSLAKSRAQSVTSGDELLDHINDQASGRYGMVSWPWPVLTRESRSLMPGSVTLVCGTPGASKSWFALSCIRHWTANHVDSAVLMLEETRKWHLQRALAQCAGDPHLLYPEWIMKNKDKANAIWQQFRDELTIVGSHFTCEGDWTLAECAEWVEQQCKSGKRVIIVDPISLADPGSERAWEADRTFMARTKAAIESAGASLVLITHPRKASGGKVQGPPSLDDLSGGAAYGRACASALWVAGCEGNDVVPIITEHGDYRQGVPRKIIRIIKARNSTGCGKTIAYTFDDLRFDELGEIAGKSQQSDSHTDQPPKRKYHDKVPSAKEDVF